MRGAEMLALMPFVLLGCMILLYAGQAFLGLCVYYDARYRGNTNAVMWGVLAGFFQLAGLIYLIITLSGKKQIACYSCWRPYPTERPVCPYCGMPSPLAYAFSPPDEREKQRGRRKLFLIFYISAEVVGILSVALMYAFIFYTTFHMVSQY